MGLVVLPEAACFDEVPGADEDGLEFELELECVLCLFDEESLAGVDFVVVGDADEDLEEGDDGEISVDVDRRPFDCGCEFEFASPVVVAGDKDPCPGESDTGRFDKEELTLLPRSLVGPATLLTTLGSVIGAGCCGNGGGERLPFLVGVLCPPLSFPFSAAPEFLLFKTPTTLSPLAPTPPPLRIIIVPSGFNVSSEPVLPPSSSPALGPPALLPLREA